MSAYYNEFDPKAAEWIRQLIKNGLIMEGVVDERSIIEVQPEDLKGFTRHHFFAGIGGWELALKLAGWPIDRPVCTASLPCQPFSVAGAQKGKEDERHLLPHFLELVKYCHFKTIFGEQVPGAIKHGWSDDLCLQMESEDYTVGQIVLTAAGSGAPHIRQRLYWVANTVSDRQCERTEVNRSLFGQHQDWETRNQSKRPVEICRVSNSSSEGCEGPIWDGANGEKGVSNGHLSECSRMGDTELHGYNATEIGRSISESETESWMLEPEGSDSISRLGDTEHDGQFTSSKSGSYATSIRHSETGENSTSEFERASTPRVVSEWAESDWIYCRDDKYRPIKPSIKPLANGISKGMVYGGDTSEPSDADNTQEARIMRLKAYGNAIVPQVAASFIKAFMSV